MCKVTKNERTSSCAIEKGKREERRRRKKASSVDDFITEWIYVGKKVIWHIRALEIILIFFDCSIIIDGRGEKPSPHAHINKFHLLTCVPWIFFFFSFLLTQLRDEVCNFSFSFRFQLRWKFLVETWIEMCVCVCVFVCVFVELIVTRKMKKKYLKFLNCFL